MASACLLYPALLHRTSQWGFRIWAILGSGPNTKKSHKPSVDLATNDCDTSLRSSRVGASLNPVSATGLLPARSLQSQGATNPLIHLSKYREKETEMGGVVAEAFPWQTVNSGECSTQEPQKTTTCEAHAQRSLSCGGTENTREPCWSHLNEEAEFDTGSE